MADKEIKYLLDNIHIQDLIFTMIKSYRFLLVQYRTEKGSFCLYYFYVVFSI